MHDLDRTLQELGGVSTAEMDEFEFELLGQEYDREYGALYGEVAVLDEVEEMELAAQLLEATSEEELDQFFGKLIRRVASGVRGAIKSPIGRALGGVLKNVAKTALPMAGAAVGNVLLPGVGGAIGGKVGAAAGKIFGLELEGMTGEDREFEIARRVVRLGTEAAKQAAQSPQTGSPVQVAKDAVLSAARRHAPGLAQTGSAVTPVNGRGGNGHIARGTWVRQGNRIVLYGV